MSILKQLRDCMKILLKNRKTPYHLTCHAAVHRDTRRPQVLCQIKFWNFRFDVKCKGIMMFPFLPTGIFGIRNLRNLPFHFEQTGSLTYVSSLMQRINSWPGLIGKCHSIFLGYFHWFLTSRFGVNASTPNLINTMIRALCPFFWIFFPRIFRGS